MCVCVCVCVFIVSSTRSSWEKRLNFHRLMTSTCEHSHAAGGSPQLLSASQSAPYIHQHHCTSHQASPPPTVQHLDKEYCWKVERGNIYQGNSEFSHRKTSNWNVYTCPLVAPYLHHGDSGVNLGGQRNMDLILVPVNTAQAREVMVSRLYYPTPQIDKCDDIWYYI